MLATLAIACGFSSLICPVVAYCLNHKRALEESLLANERIRETVAAHARWDLMAGEAVDRRHHARAPEPALQPWTPAERAAFGVDDTEEFIRETDRALNEIEWARIKELHESVARESKQGITTHFSAEEPAHYEVDDIWYDTDDQRSYRWSGQAWVQIVPVSNTLEIQQHEMGAEKLIQSLNFKYRRNHA